MLDVLTYAGNPANLQGLQTNKGFHFVQGDICDRALVGELFREFAFDTVIHFAAETHVDRSIHSAEAFLRTNVMGTHVLLEAALTAWKPEFSSRRFHHISTDEVYGSLGPEDGPFIETSPYNPTSPYAASKAASDFLVRAYANTHGLSITITNCSNNYGPYQFPEKLIPLVIVNALTGRPLPIYGDGMQVRDWLYVEDHCRGISKVLECGLAGETYNVGSGHEITNLDLITLICDQLDRRFIKEPELKERFSDCAAVGGKCRDLIRFVKDRPGHDRRYAICADRLRRELGFCSHTTLASGISHTIEWYLENDSWWRAIRSGAYEDWIELQYGNR